MLFMIAASISQIKISYYISNQYFFNKKSNIFQAPVHRWLVWAVGIVRTGLQCIMSSHSCYSQLYWPFIRWKLQSWKKVIFCKKANSRERIVQEKWQNDLLRTAARLHCHSFVYYKNKIATILILVSQVKRESSKKIMLTKEKSSRCASARTSCTRPLTL